MKKLLAIFALFLALAAAYYGVWRYRMADDVARVTATIDYHNTEFRKHNRWITFKADAVNAAGFPFHGHVHVKRPTLTFIWGDETYGVSLPYADFTLRDAASGTYAVRYAPSVEAVYAKSQQALEEYGVTPHEKLSVLMRAQGEILKAKQVADAPTPKEPKPPTPKEPKPPTTKEPKPPTTKP